jgi:hypothetical protein
MIRLGDYRRGQYNTGKIAVIPWSYGVFTRKMDPYGDLGRLLPHYADSYAL